MKMEVELLLDWHSPWKRGGAVVTDAERQSYLEIWDRLIDELATVERSIVLRDFHSPNIIWRGDRSGHDRIGLIDFQDAMIGPSAYDLVSLLQDARRDVAVDLETAMLLHYAHHAGVADEDFLADYALLGAQRNAKIVGIFTRLDRRDGKPRYLEMIPRVWDALERDLAHPALAPVARWFDANIPAELRAANGAFAA